MADLYTQLTHTPVGKVLAKQLGLPQPATLRRFEAGQVLLEGPALLGGADGGRLASAAATVLENAGAQVERTADENSRYGALVYDASGITSSAGLHDLYAFFHEA